MIGKSGTQGVGNREPRSLPLGFGVVGAFSPRGRIRERGQKYRPAGRSVVENGASLARRVGMGGQERSQANFVVPGTGTGGVANAPNS